jgi:hypothetical protein
MYGHCPAISRAPLCGAAYRAEKSWRSSPISGTNKEYSHCPVRAAACSGVHGLRLPGVAVSGSAAAVRVSGHPWAVDLCRSGGATGDGADRAQGATRRRGYLGSVDHSDAWCEAPPWWASPNFAFRPKAAVAGAPSSNRRIRPKSEHTSPTVVRAQNRVFPAKGGIDRLAGISPTEICLMPVYGLDMYLYQMVTVSHIW